MTSLPRALALLSILAASTPRAWADDAAEMRAHRDTAVHHFDLKEYELAIEEFKLAYRLGPEPELLYAIGQAERLGGRCADALLSYEAYLRTRPKPERARLTGEHVALCRDLLA